MTWLLFQNYFNTGDQFHEKDDCNLFHTLQELSRNTDVLEKKHFEQFLYEYHL
jgi:hypothetical protein